MTTMWLLPVVTLIVASSSGGILCRAIQVYSQLHALQTLTASVFMVTVGLTLALMILTIYLMRLILHGLPRGASSLSVFLPLGPTGQSGYSILLIGQNINSLLPIPSQSIFLNSSTAGAAVEAISICVSFLLWSLATMWTLYALLAVYSGLRQSRVAFNVSFWGLVFPNVNTLLFDRLSIFKIYIPLGCLRKSYNPTWQYIWFQVVPNFRILLCRMHIASLVEPRHSVVVGIEEYISACKHLSIFFASRKSYTSSTRRRREHEPYKSYMTPLLLMNAVGPPLLTSQFKISCGTHSLSHNKFTPRSQTLCSIYRHTSLLKKPLLIASYMYLECYPTIFRVEIYRFLEDKGNVQQLRLKLDASKHE